MEEFFLGAILAGKELDVVDQQRVDFLEVPLELISRFFLKRTEKRAVEIVGTQVQHFGCRIEPAHFIAGGKHQMRLAQAGGAIQQQRVVATLARLLRG